MDDPLALEQIALSELASASIFENTLYEVQRENETNKELYKQQVKKISRLEEELSSAFKTFSKHSKKDDSYKSLIDNLRCLVAEREEEIRDLAKKLDTEITLKEKTVAEVKASMNRKIEQISRDALERNVYMEGQIEKMRSKLDNVCEKNHKYETQTTFFKTELGQRDAQLKNLNAKLTFVVKNSTSKIDENEKLLKKLEQSLKKAYSELKSLEDQLSVAIKERDQAEESLSDKEEVHKELRIIINKLNGENQNLSDKLQLYDEQLSKKLQDAGASIATMKGFFSSLEAMICKKDNEIAEICKELDNVTLQYEEHKNESEEGKDYNTKLIEELEARTSLHTKSKEESAAIIMQLRTAMNELSAKLVESRRFSDSMVKKTFSLQSTIDEVNRDLRRSKEVIEKQDLLIEKLGGTKINSEGKLSIPHKEGDI